MAQQFVASLRNCKFSCHSQDRTQTHTHIHMHAVTQRRHERNLNVALLPRLHSTSGDWRVLRILHKKRTKAIENRILATRTMAMAVGSDIASCCSAAAVAASVAHVFPTRPTVHTRRHNVMRLAVCNTFCAAAPPQMTLHLPRFKSLCTHILHVRVECHTKQAINHQFGNFLSSTVCV